MNYLIGISNVFSLSRETLINMHGRQKPAQFTTDAEHSNGNDITIKHLLGPMGLF